MKKIAAAILVLCCFFVNTIASASMILEYDGGVHNYTGSVFSLSVNGKKLSNLPLEPIIFNDRALVPLREVFEALGASVNYKASDKSIDVAYGNTSVSLKIGSDTALVNGKKKTIPDNVVPRLIAKWGESAKTMVPVRFISESVGLNVDFNKKNGTISISDGSAVPAPSPSAAPAASVKLNKITYSQNGDVVTVTVSASGAVSKISKAAVTSSNVLYTDVYGASYTVQNKTDVDLGAVTAVRLGLHDDSTRIAIDTNGMKKYSVELSGDKKSIIFQISSDESADIAMPAPSTEPTQSPAPTQTPIKRPSQNNGEKIVVIDAGHGGSDPGTKGSLMTDSELSSYYSALESTDPLIASMEPGTGKTFYEKNIALIVAKKVQSKLEAQGIKVIMTRSGDTYPSLDSRPELANSKGAALFLSIHLNSTTSAVTSANGIEIFYSEQNNSDEYGITSKDMASKILKEVISATGAASRGVKSGNLLVNRKCVMPSNLIEIGFMNNPDELTELISDSYQEKLATGISRAIADILPKITLP